MQELVIKHNLSLEDNMADLELQIKKDIEKYNIVVTEDSLPETKKLMADINKQKDEFKKTYKAFKDAVLAPLVPLDVKAKAIEGYYDDARKLLDNQVKNFEVKKLEAIQELLEMYRDNACSEKQIEPESVTVTDLVKLTAVNVNKNGYTVAKNTADVIEQRIQAVENQILRAKLEAEEKARYEREIAERARIEAEEKAKQREIEILARAEREKQEALLKAEKEKEDAIVKARQEVEIKKIQEEQSQRVMEERNNAFEQIKQTPTEDGKIVYTIDFTFDIRTSATAPIDRVIETVKKMMLTETGIEKLKDAKVR